MTAAQAEGRQDSLFFTEPVNIANLQQQVHQSVTRDQQNAASEHYNIV